MFRVCFVCTGNICRSPMAEHVFRRMVDTAGLSGQVLVDSAGTSSAFVGYTADPRTVDVLRAAGYETAHTARQFRPRWLRTRDLVVALDENHARALGRLQSADAGRLVLLRSFDATADQPGVPDPYHGGRAAFTVCLDMVERACSGLLDEVSRRLRTAEA